MAAGGVGRGRRGVAKCTAEVLVDDSADVPVEICEEDAAGAQVLGPRGQLLVFLLDGGGSGGAQAAGAAAVLRFLHFGVQGQLLTQQMETISVFLKSETGEA